MGPLLLRTFAESKKLISAELGWTLHLTFAVAEQLD